MKRLGWAARMPYRWGKCLAAAAGGLLLASTAYAGFTNGGFDDLTDFNGWTRETFQNTTGIPLVGGVFVAPTKESDLGLTVGGGGNLHSVERNATQDGSSDANTNNNIKYPHWGTGVARLNFGGNNYRANGVRQEAIVNYATDADTDGKVHIRFAAAPVLQDAGHPAHEQPYFFIQVRNKDTGEVLFTTFNFANEPGFTWQTGQGDYKYTAWQTFDVPLDPADVADGAKLEFFAVAAGCAQSGHQGYLYLDMVGTRLPTGAGLWIAATGPALISQPTEADGSSRITYTYTYQNVTGSAAANNVALNIPVPPGTTFESVGGTNASACAAPAVGDTTPMACSIASMNGGDSGTFTMTVRVPANTTAQSINNASYTIAADALPAQLGSPVKTQLLPNLVPDVSQVPKSMPFGQPLPAGAQFSCTNEGATAAINGTCSISGLPTGVTAGQCTLNGVNWNSPANVPVGQTVVCPLSGTPNDPAQQGTRLPVTVTGSGTGAGVPVSTPVVAGGVPVASPASIPTLSEWSLIILSALMGLFMVGMHRRRML